LVLAGALALTSAPMPVPLLNHIPVQRNVPIRASHEPQYITVAIAGCHTKQRTVTRRRCHGLPYFFMPFLPEKASCQSISIFYSLRRTLPIKQVIEEPSQSTFYDYSG
jgi:hypothetical protein